MKNATIKFLLPNAFPISKTGFFQRNSSSESENFTSRFFIGLLAIMSKRGALDVGGKPVRIKRVIRRVWDVYGMFSEGVLEQKRTLSLK